jgi:opacity protein-like surface antigen
MKKLIFAILFTLFINQNFAQSDPLFKFGLKAGINLANYSGSDINTNTITSFHAGLVSELKVFKNFSLQPELLYSTQGAEIDELGQQFTNELGYVSIPVLGKFYLEDNLSLELGPQFSFLLSERNNVQAGDSNSFDFAVAAGLSYKLSKHFFVQGRYGLGLTEPKRDANVKNTVIQASLGYMF